MTRAPHLSHQNTSGNIYFELQTWLRRSGNGKAFMTPGVIFTNTDNVIPDVVWVSNERLAMLLDEEGYLTGVPEHLR